MNWRLWLVAVALVAVVCAVFLLPPIPQNQAYHNFADQRVLLGIPYCLDVISNVPFLIVGVGGLFVVLSQGASSHARFVDPRERWSYLVFFLGVALTAFGSAHYHLRPGNDRLVWDRIPMTIGFMALVAAVISERMSVKAGVRLLSPLVAAGIASVSYWKMTESAGRGDLRPYVLVQFGSLVVILLLVALFPPRYTRGADLLVSLAIYALAKGFEVADRPIFAVGGIVSGHTLKHITAAISAYWILRMLKLRRPISALTEAAAR